MHVAYLILAHKNPVQLARLIRRLNAPGVTFFVHIDPRSPIEPFQEELRSIPDADIQWTERVVCNWGRFGIVRATLHCLGAALSHAPRIERFVLLSGQDYPLRSAADIARYWSTVPAKTFIDYFPLPAPQWHKGGLDRIEVFALDFPGGHIIRHVIRIFYRRRLPLGLKSFGGSQWWSMSRRHAEYVMEFVRTHPEYVDFHRWSIIPDEMFFQIILLNAKDGEIREDIVGDNLRYVVWETAHSYHPKVLALDDLVAIMASNQLFARKFDATVDAEVLDRIDNLVDSGVQEPLRVPE